jgi:hypothetical protein
VAPVRSGLSAVGLALVLALAAAGCGDPLVDGGYGGVPRFTMIGRFLGAYPGIEPSAPGIRGALFWNLGGTAPIASLDELVEQWGSGHQLPFPGTIDWPVFELPGPEYLAAAPGGAAYALGVPLVYLDVDGSRLREPVEQVVARTEDVALLYAPQPLAPEDSPTGIAAPAGFSMVTAPFPCGRPPPPAATGDCGVALGAPCQVDADCGGVAGVCLRDGPWPAPGGMCAIPEPSLDGCRPPGGALAVDPRDSGRAFWLQACRAHEDCGRGRPFQCDVAFGACLPTGDVRFKGDDHLRQLPGFCAPPG